MQTQGTVVIVDAYAPNKRLAPQFGKAGYRLIRVQSTLEAPVVYQDNFDLSPYAANIVHTGDLNETVKALEAYEPDVLIAGGEMGVELADQLSEAMGLLGNGTELSAARRNKYVQGETVRAAGLRATRQMLVNDAESLAQWHREVGGRIVVKPVRSAAGDHVSFCDTPEESVAAYQSILEADTVFAEGNEAAVAQEYLAGGEYVINTVSRDGRHHVTDIWKYQKLSANGVLDVNCGIQLLPRHGEAQERLVPYAFAVLDAIGVSHGAAHLEIKLTNSGPCLVEVGSRIAGLDMPYYASLSIGEAQLEWVFDAYLNPERFETRWKTDYKLERHFISAMAVSTMDAELRSYPRLADIEKLESLHDIRQLVEPGGRLKPTVDDMSCPLIANLTHEVEEVVVRDFATFGYLDGPGFYELAGDA